MGGLGGVNNCKMQFLMFIFDLGSKLGYFEKMFGKLGSFWATFDINLGSLFRSDLATLNPLFMLCALTYQRASQAACLTQNSVHRVKVSHPHPT